MRIYKIFFILILSFACSKEKNLIVSEKINLSYFSHIVLNSPFNINLTKDSTNSLVITSAKRFISSIQQRIENDTLYLSCENKSRWLYPNNNSILIDIHYTDIREVVANETCEIITKTPIQTEKFNLVLKNKANSATIDLLTSEFTYWNNAPCGGELKLTGKTNSMAIWNFALMKVDARMLKCTNAIIENNSTGDCTATVIGELKYGISNIGNIRLTQNPNSLVEQFKTGTGEIIIE